MATRVRALALFAFWFSTGALPMPRWTAKKPDAHKPLAGYDQVPASHSAIYFGSKMGGFCK